MKIKNLVLMLATVLVCFNCFGASAINWASDGPNSGYIFDTSSNPLDAGNGTYTIMLIEAVNGTTIGFDPVTQTVGVGETLVWYATWNTVAFDNGDFFAFLSGAAPAGASGVANVSDNDYVYTVVINNTIGSATQYSILDGSTPTQIDVAVNGIGGYTTPGNNTWQPVPEPSTVALMVAGLAVVVAGRRKLRK